MFIFERHIMVRYLLICTLLLFALVVVVAISLLVEDVQHFTRSESATAATMLAILGLRSLIYSHQSLPLAAFLAALMWGALSARSGELTAAYVGGYSPWRLARPLLSSAAFLAAVTFCLGEYVVPPAANTLVRIRSHELYGTDPLASALRLRAAWYRDNNYLLHLPRVDLEQQVFQDPELFALDERGAVREWWQARSLRHAAQGWELRQGVYHLLAADGTLSPKPFSRLLLPLTVSPQDLIDLSGDPQQLSMSQLGETIARRRRTGRSARIHELQWHQRLVYPLSLFVLVLISLPLALAPRRDRGLTGALGSGSAVAALAYSIAYLFQSMVAAGDISAAWGAWLPAGLTFVAAALFYLALRRLTDLHY